MRSSLFKTRCTPTSQNRVTSENKQQDYSLPSSMRRNLLSHVSNGSVYTTGPLLVANLTAYCYMVAENKDEKLCLGSVDSER